MEKKCPYCGASLQEEASFCPYCARSINARRQTHPPRHMSGRALQSAGIILGVLILVLLLALWQHFRPKLFDNDSTEVVYRSQGVDYQLCIARASAPSTPAKRERSSSMPMGETYRYFVLVYINEADSGTAAGEAFLERIESVTADISGLDDGLQLTCAQPVRDEDYMPDALIVYMNSKVIELGRHIGELTVSVNMRNGDVICLHQAQVVDATLTYTFTPADAPMDTAADLQDLLEKIEATVGPEDEVNIQLPAVTYTEELSLTGRAINFEGTTDGMGKRTTFAAPVSVMAETELLFYFVGIDFTGAGDGVGLSVSARVHLEECRVSGWETGVLAHDYAWFNADECVFEDNTVGFHFNAKTGTPSDTTYVDNIFRNNGTAVLLEQVPSDVSLEFPGSRFQGNGTDIDNRCDQALELDEAVFE